MDAAYFKRAQERIARCRVPSQESKTPETLYQITAPKTSTQHGFCAGVVYVDGKCVAAAPVLWWAKRISLQEVMDYCAHRGWSMTLVE